MPASMLGVSENVNRANAEAAEVMFSRNIILPILELLKSVLNERLVKPLDPSLSFVYKDPTPDDREIDLREAVLGFDKNLITQNEGRALINQSSVPDGDAFKNDLFPTVSTGGNGLTLSQKAIKEANPLHPNDVNREE